jgi:hypothetical protein
MAFCNLGNPLAWGLTSFGILNVSDLMLPQASARIQGRVGTVCRPSCLFEFPTANR